VHLQELLLLLLLLADGFSACFRRLQAARSATTTHH
jgi:hypothetical protein